MGSMNLQELKHAAFAAIDSQKSDIIRLSRYINGNPETAYNEKKAAAAMTEFLSERGFCTVPGAGGVETAFTAFYGKPYCSTEEAETITVPAAILAEYDALPGIGHGCGHNLIAASAAAAGIGTAAAVDAAAAGCFRIIGTPAEEILTEEAGKNRLINAGIFKKTEHCLMFHPWRETGVALKDLGFSAFRIEYSGRPAHAAADPWNGRNALDAAVLFYNAVSMLRQQLPPGLKLHCIIPEGGVVLNVIPEYTVAEVMVRSTELDELIDIEERIQDCARAAASASGCSFEIRKMAAVKPVLFSRMLFDKAAANMELLGESLYELPVWEASSDFGDVSREVPSLALLYKTHIDAVNWHSTEVADESFGEAANDAMLQAAKVLAATAIDLIFGSDGSPAG